MNDYLMTGTLPVAQVPLIVHAVSPYCSCSASEAVTFVFVVFLLLCMAIHNTMCQLHVNTQHTLPPAFACTSRSCVIKTRGFRIHAAFYYAALGY